MGEIRENVKQNLGYFLSLRGMSQKELAMKLGVSQSAVTNWIKGKNSPDIEMVALICQHLHISVAELFGMTGDETYSDRERVLVAQYRNKPDMRRAVDILLEIEGAPHPDSSFGGSLKNRGTLGAFRRPRQQEDSMAITIKDIAVQTGLAISTISKYLNGGNVLPENQEKIRKMIDELGFSANSFARGLKTNKSHLIGVVVDSLEDMLQAKIVTAMETVFRRHGYACLVSDAGNDVLAQKSIVEFLLAQSVDGIIFLPMRVNMNDFEAYLEKEIPVVALFGKPERDGTAIPSRWTTTPRCIPRFAADILRSPADRHRRGHGNGSHRRPATQGVY